MRHQSEHVSLAITDTGDVFNRPIWIRFRHNATLAIGVAQNHLLICVELLQRRRVRKKTAFAVRHWQSKKRTLRTTVCEWRVIDLDASSNHVTYEPQRTIANQRTWQQDRKSTRLNSSH